jgi:hypothetical protein
MMTIPEGYAEVFGEIVEEREKAVLVCDGRTANPAGCKRQWFPKRVLQIDRRDDGQVEAIYCRRWFLSQNRLWYWNK